MIELMRLRDYWQHQQLSALLMAIGIGLLVVHELIRRYRTAGTEKTQAASAADLPNPVWLKGIGLTALALIIGGFGMELMLPLNQS